MASEQSRIAALEAELASVRLELERSRAANAELAAQLAAVLETIGRLERDGLQMRKRILGRTSERTTSASRRVENPRDNNDEQAQEVREQNKSARDAKVPTEDVHHRLADAASSECTLCGSPNVAAMPPDPPSTEWEYLPGRLVRRRHHRHKAICKDCDTITRAPGPPRVFENSSYGPGLIAETIVRKILDCLPLYRQAKIWRREGCPVPRSTMKDHFHGAAALLSPVYDTLVALIVSAKVVFADETSLKMQTSDKAGFIWTFACELAVMYRYAASRSGNVPVEVLGDSTGVLVVDGYSGYNHVCTPETRTRAGCNAHARRKFVDIDDDGARHVIELYKAVWSVERDAKERGIVGTDEHLGLRKERAGPAMTAVKAWCADNRDRYSPKEPLGQAITYITNQWEYLTRFLDDVRIPPDNILSERLLRVIALGRKNYLFVGNEDAGQNLAILASLVATCELHDVNPQQYLADVLIRIQSHPANDIRSLLPDVWKTRFATSATPDHAEAPGT